MSIRSNALLIAAAAAAWATAYMLTSPYPGVDPPAAEQRPAPDFQGIDTWHNSEPLKIDELRGKVVLVEFWTFACVNCLNHLPHVQRWHEKYRDQGLVVVGVHTPEFPFERSTRNVKDAIERLNIKHAVAQDNGYATWRAYMNQYWPAVYLVDKQGRIVYSHFGEGRYGETEKKIQELLSEQPVARDVT